MPLSGKAECWADLDVRGAARLVLDGIDVCGDTAVESRVIGRSSRRGRRSHDEQSGDYGTK
jgi:hypothetical protein